jgi:hypothetical protein
MPGEWFIEKIEHSVNRNTEQARLQMKDKINLVSVNAFALSFDAEGNLETVSGMPVMENVPFELKIDSENSIHSDIIVIPYKP